MDIAVGSARRRAAFMAGAAVLAACGVAVALIGDRTSLPPGLVALVVAGTSVIALVVGYGLGHYADLGRRPGG